jgi:hypothetical protein
VSFENGNNFNLTDIAASMLFVENRSVLQEEYRRRGYEALKAVQGDFIVVLPMTGYGGELSCPDNGAQISQWFCEKKVKLAYVGESVPADVQHVLRGVSWKTSRIYGANPLAEAIERQGAMNVSIFDAVRFGLPVDCVEAFQRRHFPGRSSCTLVELVPHLQNQGLLRLVHNMLNFDPQKHSRKTDLRPIAEALDVDGWLFQRIA